MTNTQNGSVTNSDKLLVSVPEAAAYLSVCARTIYNLVKAGELAPKRIGTRVLIRRSDLERYAARK